MKQKEIDACGAAVEAAATANNEDTAAVDNQEGDCKSDCAFCSEISCDPDCEDRSEQLLEADCQCRVGQCVDGGTCN